MAKWTTSSLTKAINDLYCFLRKRVLLLKKHQLDLPDDASIVSPVTDEKIFLSQMVSIFQTSAESQLNKKERGKKERKRKQGINRKPLITENRSEIKNAVNLRNTGRNHLQVHARYSSLGKYLNIKTYVSFTKH